MNYGSSYLDRGNSSFSKPLKPIYDKHNHSMKINDQSNRVLRLKSNTIFAFQNDHIYSSICNTNDNIDDDFLNCEWTNNSNFYASNCEKSNLWLQVNNDELLDRKDEESICSISSEIEKNLDFLNEIYEDDLNEAKLSLDELSEIENDCQNLNNSTTMPIVNSNDLNEFRNHSSYYKTTKSKNHFSSNKMISHFNKLVKTHSECNDNLEFTSTEGFDFSHQNQNNSNCINSKKGSLNCLFNKTNRMFNTPKANNNIFNMPNYKQSAFPVKVNNIYPFNSSNIFLNNNTNNYSNQSFRPGLGAYGQHSFSIEPWHFSNYLKENVNNRSISQMNNKNLSNLMNYQSEEIYIIENVKKLLKDQNGCRILQKKLEEKNSDFLNLFYDKVKDQISDIINNQFGNYLMQKFVECCLSSNLILLDNFVEKIKGTLLEHSNDPYGSRVIQKLIELIISKSSNINITSINNNNMNTISNLTLNLNLNSNTNNNNNNTNTNNTNTNTNTNINNLNSNNNYGYKQVGNNNINNNSSNLNNNPNNPSNIILNSLSNITNVNNHSNNMNNLNIIKSNNNNMNNINNVKNNINLNNQNSNKLSTNTNTFKNSCTTINNNQIKTNNLVSSNNKNNNSMFMFNNSYKNNHNNTFTNVNTSHQEHYSSVLNNITHNTNATNSTHMNNLINFNLNCASYNNNKYSSNIYIKISEILSEFATNNIFNLISDTNGNHVLQKIYVLSKKLGLNILHDEIMKNIFDISKLKQGASVIQKIIENGSDCTRKSLALSVINYLDKLVNDEYANFIIQMIMNMKIYEINEEIADLLISNLSDLSRKKYSSNIIDKCILFEENNFKIRYKIIDAMINDKIISEIIGDNYGNYVVQKALQVSEGFRFMSLIQLIKPCLKSLKTNNHCKKVYDNLMYNYGAYLSGNNKRNSSFHQISKKQQS